MESARNSGCSRFLCVPCFLCVLCVLCGQEWDRKCATVRCANKRTGLGRPGLSPNLFQVADVEQFLSAKDAKDANKSEGTCQSDHRHGKRSQLGMRPLPLHPLLSLRPLRPLRPLRTRKGPEVRDSSMREQAHRQGRPGLSPNLFQVTDVEQFLSAKDAKDAKKSVGTCQSDHRYGERTRLGMLPLPLRALLSLRPLRPLRTRKGPEVRVSSMRETSAPAGATWTPIGHAPR